jgi:hypothetical protein
MDHRHHQVSDRLAARPHPCIHLRQARILHRSGQVMKRRSVVHAVDDDVLVKIERAGRVVQEKRELLAGTIDGEQERAIAAAVRIVLADARAKAPGCGVGHRRAVEFAREVLDRIGRVAAVIPTHHTHRDAVTQVDLFAAVDGAALARRHALRHRLQAGGDAADHRRAR